MVVKTKNHTEWFKIKDFSSIKGISLRGMLDLMVFDNDTTNIPSLNHIMDYYTRKYKKLKAIKIADEQSIHCKVVFNKMILIAWFLAYQKHGFSNFHIFQLFKITSAYMVSIHPN